MLWGRPLREKAPGGRDHWQLHNVLFMFGARVRAGVVGGLRPTEDGKDFQSLPISSTSGAGSMDGDISVDDSLASAGKTLGVALGLEQAVVDEAINKGKVVQAAVLPQ